MEISNFNHGILGRLLDATAQRHGIVSENIAHQDVPGYHRKELKFESLLQDALESGSKDLSKIEAMVVTDHETPARADGNNVVPELEVNELRRTELLYEAYLNIGSARMELIRAAIQDGR